MPEGLSTRFPKRNGPSGLGNRPNGNNIRRLYRDSTSITNTVEDNNHLSLTFGDPASNLDTLFEQSGRDIFNKTSKF